MHCSHAALTWQQAVNEPSSSAPYEDVQELLNSQKISLSQGIIQWTNKSYSRDPCAMTLANFQEVIFLKFQKRCVIKDIFSEKYNYKLLSLFFFQPVTCIAVSPDNQHFACGSADCSLKLYDMSTGKVAILKGIIVMLQLIWFLHRVTNENWSAL